MTTARSAEMNVTPMIDVLLVLIIIFLVIGERAAGLEAQIPQEGGEESVARQIVVSVGEDRSLRINAEAVEWRDLKDRLREIFISRPGGVLFVAGARQADFEDVARVLDTARGVGIARVALMPKQTAGR